MKVFGVIVIVFLACWIGRGIWVNRGVKRPPVISSQWIGVIEKRTIASVILASVTVPEASQNSALNEGFRQLAGYIFGDNVASTQLAMTAPVTSTQQSEKIAMTAPVISASQGSGYVVNFVMPSEYTLETLPKPKNANIRFTKQDPKTYYVWHFGRYAGENRANAQLIAFKQELEQQQLAYAGTFTLAQYNDPWTPPWMRENEWRVEAK